MGACGARGRVVTATKPADHSSDPKTELQLFYVSQQAAIKPRLKTVYEQVLAQDTQQVDTLNLQFSCLGAQQMPFLTRVLEFFPQLRILKLWKAKVATEGAHLLGPSLAKLQSLEVLGLEDNQLYDEGAAAIADALTPLRLKELFLQVNCFGESGTAALALALAGKDSLDCLNLSENRPGVSGLKRLLEACGATLRELELAHCDLGKQGADVLLEAWSSFARLRKLKVSGNGFGDELERSLLQKSAQIHVLI